MVLFKNLNNWCIKQKSKTNKKKSTKNEIQSGKEKKTGGPEIRCEKINLFLVSSFNLALESEFHFIGNSNKRYIKQIIVAALLFCWPHLLWMINSFETYQINIKLNFIGCDELFFLPFVSFTSPSMPSILAIQTMLIYFLNIQWKECFFFDIWKRFHVSVCVCVECFKANDNIINKVRDFEILWLEWWFKLCWQFKIYDYFFRCSLIDFIFFYVGDLLNEITCSIGPVPVNIRRKVKIELWLFFYENWMRIQKKKTHFHIGGPEFHSELIRSCELLNDFDLNCIIFVSLEKLLHIDTFLLILSFPLIEWIWNLNLHEMK